MNSYDNSLSTAHDLNSAGKGTNIFARPLLFLLVAMLNFVCFLMLLNKVSFVELYQNNEMIPHILLTLCSYMIFVYTVNAANLNVFKKFYSGCTIKIFSTNFQWLQISVFTNQ